jgi:signal transduction histidine kinase
MTRPVRLGTVEAMEATPRWARRDDGWWAGVGAALALATGIITALAVSGHGVELARGQRVDATRVRIEAIAASAVCAAVLLARRRWPGLPTAVLAVFGFAPAALLMHWQHVEGTMFLLVVTVSYVAITETDDRTRLAVGAVAVALPVVINYNIQLTWGWPYWTMGITFAWLSAIQTRRFRQLVVELEATRERLAEQAVFTERRRIAADLHDLVGHSLTVVLLFLTGARRRVHEDPSKAEEALTEAEEIARRSLLDIRRSVAGLRHDAGPADLQPAPGVCDVPRLIEQARSAGSDIGLEVVGPVDQVETVTGLAVYRVVQESLANAAKHAPGAVVHVRVDVDDNAVGVEVVDRGGSRSSGGIGGVGLIGMRERVEALGGRLTAGPGPEGWRVDAILPRGSRNR